MKISIITINYNNKDGFRKTIESVVSQSYSDVEFVVIDGGSTDGSAQLLTEFKEKISFGVSESDKGIYNAMNKGIHYSTGEYLLFLNSGDWLYDDSVIGDFVGYGFNADIVDGNVCAIYGKRYVVDKSPETGEANFGFFYKKSLWHQAAFIRRDTFDKYGFYNEDYRIAGDWDFFMRAICFHGAVYEHWDRLVSYYPFDGISSRVENEGLKAEERKLGLLKYVPSSVIDSYEDLIKELDGQRLELEEYRRLKKGRFGGLVKGILRLKKNKKRFF